MDLVENSVTKQIAGQDNAQLNKNEVPLAASSLLYVQGTPKCWEPQASLPAAVEQNQLRIMRLPSQRSTLVLSQGGRRGRLRSQHRGSS